MNGKIAVVDRGICGFNVKVKNAQDAGAVGVLVVNNAAGTPPPGLGGTDPTVTIPSVMITQADGNTVEGRPGHAVPGPLGHVCHAGHQSGRSTPERTPPLAPGCSPPIHIQGGSSVSHWDISAFPNQLMEPAINGDLTHEVTPPFDLTFMLLKDIGWN